MKVSVDVDAKKILKSRGLGGSNGARKHLASLIAKKSEPYTPFQQGILAHSHQIASDGSQIVYPGPYAHYQWEGIVLGPNYTNGERFWSGNAPKKPTGKSLTYSGAPMRGKKWTERMWADKRKEIEKDLEKHIGGG